MVRETEHPTSHYIDAVLDRSTECNHQPCLELNDRQLPSPVSISLFYTVSLPFPTAFLDLFYLLIFSLLSLSKTLPSLSLFKLPFWLAVFYFSPSFFLYLPLLVPYLYCIPTLPISLSVSVCHILSSQWSWQLVRWREWTMTFPFSFLLFLNNISRVGQAEPRPERALMWLWRCGAGA